MAAQEHPARRMAPPLAEKATERGLALLRRSVRFIRVRFIRVRFIRSLARRNRVPPRRGAPAQRWIATLILASLLLSIGGAAFALGLTVGDLRTTLQSAQAHLQRAEALSAQVSAAPFDDALLQQMRGEVAGAERDFRSAQTDVERLAPGSIVPGPGAKVSDAQALLEMALALTSGGRQVLDAAIPVLDSLRASLATPSSSASATPQPSPQAGAGLTVEQLMTLQQAIHTLARDMDQADTARGRIHDNGASLDPSVAHLLARYDQMAPGLRSALSDAETLATAAPLLLGVEHPASYLIEILDETELRGGGGFMGNYGIVSVTGGRVATASVRDTYLLDFPYEAAHTRAFPAEYAWFHLASSMGLRDSNLSPDFAYNAQLAERILTEESGQSVVGVAAITPAFIARLLDLTGPVQVPGYNVTVTAQNLVDTIHYYQFLTNDQGVPSSDGLSSTRKHFTAMLGDAVFARVRALPPSALHDLLTLAQNGLKTKDLQLYVNDAGVEALLAHAHLANTLDAADGSADSLELVDNNVGGNKADLYVTQTTSDEVVARTDGSVQHTLTVRYTYRPASPVHGPWTFADEVQVIVPPGSTFTSQTGLDKVDTPIKSYGRAVFGGRISLAPFSARTVVLSWITPALPGTAHGYRLWITRQAGSIDTFATVVHPPASASGVQASAPLALASGSARYATPGPLATDLDLAITWR